MAELKRQTFLFSTGKQIRLYGTGFGITKSLEIGEAFAPNIFSLFEGQDDNKTFTTVSNPHRLTNEELHELADYGIRLWMDLKDSIRKHGANNPRVFNRDDIRLSGDNKSDNSPKKEKNKASHPKEKDSGKGDTSGKEKGNKATNSDEDKSSKDGITEEIKVGN